MINRPDAAGEANFDTSGSAMASNRYRRRYYAELCLAGFTGFLAVLTVAWPAWIEGIFGWDPDNHSGAFEVLIITGLAAATACLVLAAWSERRATRRQPVLNT